MKLQRVAIHGVPRSGTSWLGELFNSSPSTIYKFQPLFSYAFKDFLSTDSDCDRIEEFFTKLPLAIDEFLDQVEKRRIGILPTFGKAEATHLVYKEVRYHNVLCNVLSKLDDVKLVAVIRDPIAALESWINAPREFRHDLGWRVEDEWRFAPSKNQNRPEEFFGFEGWLKAAKIFHKLLLRHPQRVQVVRYEDLAVNPKNVISRLFEFCSLDLSGQTLEFIDQSGSKTVNDPYSVYRETHATQSLSRQLSREIKQAIVESLKGGEFERYVTGSISKPG